MSAQNTNHIPAFDHVFGSFYLVISAFFFALYLILGSLYSYFLSRTLIKKKKLNDCNDQNDVLTLSLGFCYTLVTFIWISKFYSVYLWICYQLALFYFN